MGEKGLDPGSAHVGRVTQAVEVDIAFDPADVGLLGAIRVVFEAAPPFDRRGFQAYNIVIVGSVQQADCPKVLGYYSRKSA